MSAPRVPGGRVGRAILWAVSIGIVVFLVAPIVVIVIVSFNDAPNFSFPPQDWSLRWYRALIASPAWRDSAWLSFTLGVAVMVASLAMGTPAAYALARGRFAGSRRRQHLRIAVIRLPDRSRLSWRLETVARLNARFCRIRLTAASEEQNRRKRRP